MASPEVSIVLPTFNRLRHLRAAVDSVLAQTFSDWELIVADDGSEAETAAYLAALEDPPRIRVLRLRHTGNPGAVRNAALREARGEYVAFLDSDDVWLPQKLARQLASLRSHPQRAWSHTAFEVIDAAGERLGGAQTRSWPAGEGWILECLVRMEIVIAPASVIVRRQLLEQAGGFDIGQRACEDYDLWLRLARLSEIDGVDETLLLKRSNLEPFYHPAVVSEDLGRALEKLLATGCDPHLHALVRRERARAAVALARNQAMYGGRRAALHTLFRSIRHSWEYPEWWYRGARAAARAVAPPAILRLARFLTGRGQASHMAQR